MSELKILINISKYAGERFDLVQAGGGNSSVKFSSGEMIIKASGFLLSEVNTKCGYSKVSTDKIANIVKNREIINSKDKREREAITSNLVKEATIDKENRPSIETLLHSLLLKCTLHTHPIVVNMILIREDWKSILNDIFKTEKFIMVEYETPGIELALALNNKLQEFKTIPNIIFLQNHGLIITSNSKHETKQLTEYVLKKIENYLEIDMKQYKLTNKLTKLLNSVSKNTNVSYLSEDHFLYEQLHDNKDLFFSKPFCPDSLVYCGICTIEINDLKDTQPLEKYLNQSHKLPKVIIFKNNLFFIAENIKKTKEIEEIFKFNIMILKQNKNSKNNFLKDEEISYLSNWEAEKYRQNI
jgi:rhamnose utilization protein RhaD (predicted bifunctional aldolase and dehydrogenase)